jgi:hypothetical protein
VNGIAFYVVIIFAMNATLHIEHVDESVMRTLKALAHDEHVSIEEAARRVLARLAAPLDISAEHDKHVPDKNEVLRSISGSWTKEEVEEFERNTAPFREIDPDLWK